jgi:hypothetical protein
MTPKFECPFINAIGERHVAVVELNAAELQRCKWNPRTADNIARAFAALRAVRQLPAGFTALDLDLSGVRRRPQPTLSVVR